MRLIFKNIIYRLLTSHKNFYPEYMSLDDVKKGLESGELFEAKIRISQKCHSEAYVPSPVRIFFRKMCGLIFKHSFILYRINLKIYC